MSSRDQIQNAAVSNVIIREPTTSEMVRAIYLFRDCLLRPQSRLLVAVRSQPVERFVAAVAWWVKSTFARFQLAGQVGATDGDARENLVSQVVELARLAEMERIQYADLLTKDDPLAGVLRKSGFDSMGANRFFEVKYQDAWNRVTRFYEQYRTKIPSDWRTESIREHSPQLAWDLIGGHRLMPPTELNLYWRSDCPFGFELNLSSILFAGSQPIGILLTRAGLNALFVDVRVVRLENPRLRALGNILLFHHMAERCRPGGEVQRLQFHGGEAEHRETANLALRMGGHELPSRYIFAKQFRAFNDATCE